MGRAFSQAIHCSICEQLHYLNRAQLPARIQPGSFEPLPLQQFDLVLGRLWLYERELAGEKSLSLPVPGHTPVRPQKSQCILLSRRSLE
ncbi:UNVERIFIED_CONTAM: hypothetical protein Slati_4528900 [Sesamum latifolium]|uniref:Uncharacterized protein n=1 Tax=Sesamum latifolium TaxID=2727402 RepID=A0AAW2S2Z2_9LAMI